MRYLKSHFFVAMLLLALVATGLQARLRDAILDARFNLIQRPASGQIALVEIDSRSIAGIGVWPWPRTLHAQLVRSLEKAGVTDIAFDVDFSSASTPVADEALADALRNAGGSVILAAFRQLAVARGDGKTLYVNRPIPAFAASSWLALVNVNPDRDGIIRHYDHGNMIDGAFLPSMGALLAGSFAREAPAFLIDFGIRTASVPTVSFIDVLQGDPLALQAVAGKKVIISGTAVELGDRFHVPNSRIIPGSMVQLLGAESIMQGRALAVSTLPVAIGLAGFLIALMLLIWFKTRAMFRFVCVAAAAILAEASALALQHFAPIAADTSLVLAAAVTYALAIGFEELDLRAVLRSIAERRFQNIAVALGDGLVCTDDKGVITLWNPGASTIFGYESGEVIGQSFDRLLAARPAAAGAATGEEALAARLPDERAAPDFAGLSAQVRQLRDAGPSVVDLVGVRKSGALFDLECSLSAWEGEGGLQYGAVLRDISQRKRQQERIRYLAEFDTLTGLPNRNSLITHLEGQVAEAATPRRAKALLLIGIRHFDQINDLYGHSFGDKLLVAIARQLGVAAEAGCYLARLGSDEFALVIPAANEGEIRYLCEALLAASRRENLSIDGQDCRVSLAIGAAQIGQAASAEELLGNAHFALSAARAAPAAAPVSYQQEMRVAIERRSGLESELRAALEHGEFELFYQPQVDLATGALTGAEALIRWRHAEKGYMSPGAFLPVVNTTTLSKGVADWVLETACRQGASWQRAGHHVRIGVNLAQSQFNSGDLVADVARNLLESGLEPGLLELELTEDIVLDRIEEAQATLAAIRALGVRTAFDDFGTGYGSLTYLKTFPLDKIKIDQTFVRCIRQAGDDAAIVTSVVMLSRALGLSVIAEGVEDRLTADLLMAMGCPLAQGYFFGQPMPAADFERQFLSASGTGALSESA